MNHLPIAFFWLWFVITGLLVEVLVLVAISLVEVAFAHEGGVMCCQFSFMAVSQFQQKLVSFFLLQPINVAICTIMMIFTVFLERDAFVIHVFGVTFLLLVVLHKVNLCYGKIENPYRNFEKLVIIGGIIHCFVPIAGMFKLVAMYVHVGFCFTVHVLHLSESYLVFKDIKMQDRSYIVILWTVNIMEFVVNITYCFPDQISSNHFIIPMLVTEISAQLLSSLKLKPLHNPQHHTTSTANTASTSNTSAIANDNNWQSQLQQILTSRVSVAISCTSTIGISIGIHRFDFAIYITGLSCLFCLILLHFHHHTTDYHPTLTKLICFLVPSLMTPLAWLGDLRIIPRSLDVIVILATSLPIVVLILLKFHRLMGFHYTFQMSIIGGLIYISSLVLYAIQLSDPRYYRAAMVCTISCVMAIMLTDLKLGKGRRKVHMMNPSESKNSDAQSAASDASKPNSHLSGTNQVQFCTAPIGQNGSEKL